MKILLSAYACEPDKGSEPGVGWNWAIELEKMGHEIHVITRSNNRRVIEHKFKEIGVPNNIDFNYYDLPKWLGWWKKGQLGIRAYYILWQVGIVRKVARLNRKNNFDLIHHITFGVVRHPSFLGIIGKNFIIGPLGGGERSPIHIRKKISLRDNIVEVTRDIANLLIKIDPLMGLTFSSADQIIVKTPESMSVLPVRYQNKAIINLEIGTHSVQQNLMKKRKLGHPPRVLFVGRLLYWKGGELALRAFSKLYKNNSGSKLTIVGNGPKKKHWNLLANQLNIANAIDWITWVPQLELFNIYQEHDSLLFPSLHDSSGNVVLEAMSYGLPVVCLDLGGPGTIVSSDCGYKIDAMNQSYEQIVEEMGDALIELASNEQKYNEKSQNCISRAKSLSWENVVTSCYSQVLGSRH